MGVGERINRKMCIRLVTGILNLMREMEMWNGDVDVTQLKELPYVCKGDSVEFLNAEASGIFLTDMTTGNMVDEGDEIGLIVSPLEGKILSRVVSPCHGFLFTIRAYPIVYEGSLMARIFKTNE